MIMMRDKVLVIFISIVVCTSCNNTPKCGDAQVKRLAVDAGIKSYLKNAAYSDKIKMGEYLRGNENAFDGSNLFLQSLSDEYVNSLEGLANLYGKNIDSLQIAIIDSAKNAGGITISDIRMTTINDELKQCGCGGNLNFNDVYYKINYTVQKTEDGQIYVEAIIDDSE